MSDIITIKVTRNEAGILMGMMEEAIADNLKNPSTYASPSDSIALANKVQSAILDGLFPTPTFPCRQGCGNEAAKFDTDCDVCAGK